MKIVRSKDFTGSRAWEALDIANMNGITTRLHWTDQPYRWHINDGEEVFVVLDGRVQMHYRDNGFEQVAELGVGDIFYASVGTELQPLRIATPASLACASSTPTPLTKVRQSDRSQ